MDREEAFVRAHTTLEVVPLVPEIRLHTASEVTPLWQATERWLEQEDVAIPFWSVPWAGGQGLARFVLDRGIAGARVLDFASGSGLVAIAARMAGADAVTAVDVDPVAIAACRLNAAANGVDVATVCRDLVGDPLDAFDVVLAGDIFYEREASGRFVAWLSSLDRTVWVGDPGRPHVPDAPELARYEVPTPLELESVASRTTRVLALAPALTRSR